MEKPRPRCGEAGAEIKTWRRLSANPHGPPARSPRGKHPALGDVAARRIGIIRSIVRCTEPDAEARAAMPTVMPAAPLGGSGGRSKRRGTNRGGGGDGEDGLAEHG